MSRPDLLERLLERRTSFEKRAQARNESFAAKSAGTKHLDYVIRSMHPIEKEYTDEAFAVGERVRARLAARLSSVYEATYDYQGSVTSDTHVRAHSDIDLLVMDGRRVSVDAGAPNPSPYQGDSVRELVEMRDTSAAVLRGEFPTATVDDKPGKAIALSGEPLEREVDVVVGNWWDTQTYEASRQKRDRGISIIDTKVPERVRNLPFLHNFRIDEKDRRTSGLRKALRFLKSVKYDAETPLKMSSYDITAVTWNMPDSALSVVANDYLGLASNAVAELRRLLDDTARRDSLAVPNGTRKVFGAGGTTLEQLRALHTAAEDIVTRARAENAVRVYNFSFGGPQGMVKRGWVETLPESVKAHMY